MKMKSISALLILSIILPSLPGLKKANAHLYEIPLECEGYYVREQTWTADFDLGTTLIEISNVYIDWSGSIRAEFAEDLVTGERFPMDAQFVANIYNFVTHDFCGSASHQTGAATYPNPEPFDLKSTFSNEGWSTLLNGQGTIEIGFWGIIRPMTIITIEDPNGELTSATLVIEAIPPEPRTITVGLGAGYDFNTIQAAIDDANDGDTIVVADGTYTGDGNRDIEFLGKEIVLRSKNGPENCVIDCNGTETDPHRGFFFRHVEDSNSVLDGFTITNGYDQVSGGGIVCSSASPTISNCIITNNRAKDDGGGIMCHVANPTIRNCIITKNRAEVWEGGGIRCRGCKGATLDNCIITENSAVYGGGIGSSGDNSTPFGDIILTNCTFSANSAQYGGAVYVRDGSKPSMFNCILWGDTALYGPEIALLSMWPVAHLYVSFSDVQGGEDDVYDDGYLYWEAGNINADPCFADPCNGDYHLKSQAGRWDANEERWTKDEVTSHCIDAGDPKSPIGIEPFPNGGRINMGAYGGTTGASKSYFGKPVCETIVAGDINGDCIVNFKDFALMALHWLRDENQ